MEMNDKLRVAMIAGYYAIINNRKLEGSHYHNFETRDEMSFHEADSNRPISEVLI